MASKTNVNLFRAFLILIWYSISMISAQVSDNWTPVESVPDPRSVIDHLEPELDVRAVSLQYIRVLEAFAAQIGDGLTTGDIRTANTAFWGSAYGLGLSICSGVSISEQSAKSGVSVSAVSEAARTFVEVNGLKPPRHMIDARLTEVAASNASNGNSPPSL